MMPFPGQNGSGEPATSTGQGLHLAWGITPRGDVRMDPAHEMAHDNAPAGGRETWRLAVAATLHCLTGCAIGEVLGMVIATAIGLGNVASIVLSIVLAFTFGYGLTIRPLLGVMSLRRATRLALASDTVSITTMEIVDNLFIVAVPGALAASLAD